MIRLAIVLGVAFPVMALAQEPYPPPPPPQGAPQPAPAPAPPPQPTYAQPAPGRQAYYGPPPWQLGIQRDGFLIGFSLGGGAIGQDCRDCDNLGGVALDFHLGGMLNERLGLMYDLFLVVHSVDSRTSFSQGIHTASVQYFFDRLWLKGGLGVGQLQISDDDGDVIGESEAGGAILLAIGYELYQGTSMAVDLQVRIAGVTYREDVTFSNTGVTIGVNWY